MTQPVTANDIMSQRSGVPSSQATSIEQSRAVAEVQAAIIVAQQRPRDEAKALNKALESCRTMEVAESAFFKFKRGNSTISDATIHLAVELARCWGNVNYGIMELDRDDAGGKSEMLAFAWDLETNTQSRVTFIVPHKRDKSDGGGILTSMRDIYENNANNGARRLRECIWRVLPPSVKERAKAECHRTLVRGQGEMPIAQRIAEAVDAYAKIGISRDRIEAKLGPMTGFTPADFANLQVSYRSITRNEIAADDEFPRVGVEDTTAAARKLADKSKSKPKNEQADTVSPDNPTAAERRDDSDMGQAYTDDDVHPARKAADEIIRAAQLAGNIIDLLNLKSGREKDIAAMPDEIAAEVNKALDSHELRLRQKNKK